jgi:hypothetical protein
MDQFEITISMVNYLLYVIIIMLIYGIKIIRKMHIILTGKNRRCSEIRTGVFITFALVQLSPAWQRAKHARVGHAVPSHVPVGGPAEEWRTASRMCLH